MPSLSDKSRTLVEATLAGMAPKPDRAAAAAEGTGGVLERHATQVMPTVVVLRAKGAKVATAELARLSGKLGELDHRAYAEIAQAIYRVADQLLQMPAARAEQLARHADDGFCETALRMLFDLDR